MVRKLTRRPEVEYPESDGKPMAESDIHRDWMIAIILKLQNYFVGRRVYVSGNLLIYYQKGDPRKSVAPDAFIVKNCNPRRRLIFKIWEEKRVPCFVLETTSKTTRREDLGKKKTLYAQLGIAEYFLYDPLAEWLSPPLQGFRLENGNYELISADPEDGLVSRELGIRFRLEEGDLVMSDAATGALVFNRDEQKAEEERPAKEKALRQVRQLEEELARLRDSDKKTNGSKRKPN